MGSTPFTEFTNTMMKKRTPVTLPDGRSVLLHPLGRQDAVELDKWIQKQYMKNVTEACEGLNQAARLELQLAALNHAASLSFSVGDGRDILFGNSQGLARFVYQMIDNPPMTFDEFDELLFPETFLNLDGIECIGKMIEAAYENVTPTSDEEKQRAEELNLWFEDRMKKYLEAMGYAPKDDVEVVDRNIVPETSTDEKQESEVDESETGTDGSN